MLNAKLILTTHEWYQSILTFPDRGVESARRGSVAEPRGPYLSDHAVPPVVDLLAVFPIRHQVQVVGELDVPGDLLQNVNAETFAALLNVGAS